jgi:hypothetical protein
LLGAVVELLAIATFGLGTAFGLISVPVVLLFVTVGLGYGTFLTIVSVLAEELTYHRYRSWRDFALLIYAAIAENVGYRQLYAWWRVRGIADTIARRKATWVEQPADGPPAAGQSAGAQGAGGQPAGGQPAVA